jgi:N-ethylmaleimide reductase
MLFDPIQIRSLSLTNRTVMAPLTRSRALGNRANSLMATYYAQRASAGLIITEGVSPSPNGLGYARIPGLLQTEDVDAWRVVTDAVHAAGGRIVVQLMHAGRVAHLANLPPGAKVLAPVAGTCPGEIWTDTQQLQAHSPALAMTPQQIQSTIEEYVHASELALAAGFDGVELHAANGYLIEQFLNANVNTRTDEWGGTLTGRNRFALAVANACAEAIGAEKIGMRLSPYGMFNSTGAFPDVDAQYQSLASSLSDLGLLYLHVLDHSSMGAPPVPTALKRTLRALFKGPFILAGGFDAIRAEAALRAGEADLIAFGRPFLANPDLVLRMKTGSALNRPDPNTFYTAGAEGYTDYPTLDEKSL